MCDWQVNVTQQKADVLKKTSNNTRLMSYNIIFFPSFVRFFLLHMRYSFVGFRLIVSAAAVYCWYWMVHLKFNPQNVYCNGTYSEPLIRNIASLNNVKVLQFRQYIAYAHFYFSLNRVEQMWATERDRDGRKKNDDDRIFVREKMEKTQPNVIAWKFIWPCENHRIQNTCAEITIVAFFSLLCPSTNLWIGNSHSPFINEWCWHFFWCVSSIRGSFNQTVDVSILCAMLYEANRFWSVFSSKCDMKSTFEYDIKRTINIFMTREC